MSGWTRWADDRPSDHTAAYRWRVSARPILGLTLRPEWTEKLHCCGMGYAENEWWPPFSHWNGYRRTVDPSLEWRVAAPDDMDLVYGGLDLLPSPFTGRPPKVVTSRRWIGAPPYLVEWIGIESYMVKSLGWTDAGKMRDAWNSRPALIAAAPDLVEAAEAAALAIGDWSRPTSANGMTMPRADHPLLVAAEKLRAALLKANGG